MSDRLESVKETIHDHQAEVVAAVAITGLVGTLIYYHHKEQKRIAEEAAKRKAARQSLFRQYLDYRQTRAQLKLAHLNAA